VVSHARLHAELIGLLRQHSPFCDQRHLVLLAQKVAGLLLSQTVCFDRWKTVLPLGHCLAASWQRRCQRWLCNTRIDVEALYGPLVLWALQHWQKPGQALHLALDTTMLWNRCCVVVLSVVCHGRAIPLLWRTLEHPSASVSASVSIALLEKADRLLAAFGAITLLADRAFPSEELLSWFDGKARWSYVMRLRSDTWIHGTAAPMGCEVRRLRLPRGHCRGFRDVQLWADGSQKANLFLAHPSDIAIDEPWYLVGNADPTLDLVWSYAKRFCCEQLFRDQKSGLFQLESSGLRDPGRIRSTAPGGGDRGAGEQPPGLCGQSRWPAPSGGSPLATRHELCADRPEVAATSRGKCRQDLADVDADPTARAGAVHPQPWRPASPETALVHAD